MHHRCLSSSGRTTGACGSGWEQWGKALLPSRCRSGPRPPHGLKCLRALQGSHCDGHLSATALPARSRRPCSRPTPACSKAFLIEYERGLRVIILTANAIYPDCNNKSQVGLSDRVAPGWVAERAGGKPIVAAVAIACGVGGR